MRIALTRGQFALVDDGDAELVAASVWCAGVYGNTWYAYRRHMPGEPKYLHHLISGLSRVDHVNGDGLDNRRENLRQASHLQNAQNMRKSRGSSRYKGVMWDTTRRLWRVSIGVNRRTVALGRFSDERDAARAYDDAARAMFGDFAALNFPCAGERSAHRRVTV